MSRSSAPQDAVRFKQIQKTIEKRRLKAVKTAGGSKKSVGAEVLDDEAKDEHRVVTINQVLLPNPLVHSVDNTNMLSIGDGQWHPDHHYQAKAERGRL